MMELKKQSRKSLKIIHAKNKKTGRRRRRSLEIGSLYLVEKEVLGCFKVISII